MPNSKSRIVVCIDSNPRTLALLHEAKSKALENKTSWEILHIETPNHYLIDPKSQEKLLKFITIAQNMGAIVNNVVADNPLNGIVNFVKNSHKNGENPITNLIIGQSQKDGFFKNLKGSLAEKINRNIRHLRLQVQIIFLANKKYKSKWFDKFQIRKNIKIRELIFSTIITAIFFIFFKFAQNLSIQLGLNFYYYQFKIIIIMGCLIISMRYGIILSLYSILLSFFLLYFFPSQTIKDIDSFELIRNFSTIKFLIFSSIFCFIGSFSQANKYYQLKKEKRLRALYDLHKSTSVSNDKKEVVKIIHKELQELLEMKIVLFVTENTKEKITKNQYPKNVNFSNDDKKLLNICWNKIRTTGFATPDNLNSNWRFEPLVTTDKEIGILAIKIPKNIDLDSSFGRLITAIADQVALIINRIDLLEMMNEGKIREEKESLRSMLLSSVSHDLKTPLVSIIGSLKMYQKMALNKDSKPEIRNELINTAIEESERLESFICNILEMTRLERDEVKFNQEWVEYLEPVFNIKKRLKHKLANYEFEINYLKNNYQVFIDQIMTQQVLQNVIDNAMKFAPKNSKITVSFVANKNGFKYKIKDQGPGIAKDKLKAIFNKYERLNHHDRKYAGTGLGLAISKEIMKNQEGSITVKNHKDGGCEFSLWFPQFKKYNL